jgi:hypothetical protein
VIFSPLPPLGELDLDPEVLPEQVRERERVGDVRRPLPGPRRQILPAVPSPAPAPAPAPARGRSARAGAIAVTYAVWWDALHDDGSSFGSGYDSIDTTEGRSGTSTSPGTGHGSP